MCFLDLHFLRNLKNQFKFTNGRCQVFFLASGRSVHLENEKYNPSLKLAMDIAKVFGVPVEELFEYTDS